MSVGKHSTLEPSMYYQSPLATLAQYGQEPGKRTLTEGLAQQVHEQEKQVCDGRSDDSCFLSPEDRRRLDDDIRTNISKASLAWTTALTNKRIDLLAKHKEGWSSLWKIGAAIALGAIPIGVDIGVAFAAEAETVQGMQVAARLVNHQALVEGVLDFAGEEVVDRTKDAVSESANRTGDDQADYLSTQLDGPGLWGAALAKHFPKALDDLGRLLLLGVTDPKVMTVASFTKQIDAILDRWKEQVGDLGDVQGDLIRTVAWISNDDGSDERLAMVMAWLPPDASSRDNNLIPQVFVKWVDEDMVPYALEMQEKRRIANTGRVTLGDLSGAPTDPKTMHWRRYGDPSTAASED